MRRVALGLVILLVGLACKKSVEGESKSWEKNSQRFSELSTLYPGFKEALQKQLTQAQEAMTVAKAAADQESVAEKMAAVNKTINAGLAGSLGKLEEAQRSLRAGIVDATGAAVDESDRQAAKIAAEEARALLGTVEGTLKQGATELAAAETIVRKALADLGAAGENLKRVIATANAKKTKLEDEKKAAEAKVKAAADLAQKDQEAKEKAAAPWKCEYCGALVDAKEPKCKSCGAARGQ